MEGNIASLCAWGDGNRNADLVEMNLFNPYDQHQANSVLYKRQISPSQAKLSWGQQIERNQMAKSLEKTFQESFNKIEGASNASLQDKIKREFLKDAVDPNITRNLPPRANFSNMPINSFPGSSNMDNFDAMTSSKFSGNQYAELKTQEVDTSLLPLSQSQFIVKSEAYQRNSHSQMKHSNLPSLNPYPYQPYSQTLHCPGALPSFPSHIFGMSRYQMNPYQCYNSNDNSFNAASMMSKSSVSANTVGSNMTFLPFNNNVLPGHTYGAQQCGLNPMSLNTLNMAFPSPGGIPYPNAIYEKSLMVKEETDEDERRKANQRRRKAESRKRLRERDPVGYREKEAKARRDRRMKQKARLLEKNESISSKTERSKKKESQMQGNSPKDPHQNVGIALKRQATSPEGVSFEPITDDEITSEISCSTKKESKSNKTVKDDKKSKQNHSTSSHSSTTSETASSKDYDAVSGSSEYTTSAESNGSLS